MSSTASSTSKKRKRDDHIRMYSMLFQGPDKRPHFVKFVKDHIRSDFNLSNDDRTSIIEAIETLNQTQDYTEGLDDTINILLHYDYKITGLFDLFQNINETRRTNERIFSRNDLVGYLRDISKALKPPTKTSERSHTKTKSLHLSQKAHKYNFKSMIDTNGFTPQARADAINPHSRVITFTANTHNVTHTISVCILIAPSNSGINVYYFDQELINGMIEGIPYRRCYVQFGSDVWIKLQEFFRSASGHEFELNIQSIDTSKQGLIRTILAYDIIKRINPDNVTIDQKFQQISITQKYAAIMMDDNEIGLIIGNIIQTGDYGTSFRNISKIVSKYSDEIYIYNEVPSLPSSTNIHTLISMLRSVTNSNSLTYTQALQCSMWASIANHSHNLYTPSEVVVTETQMDCLNDIVKLFQTFKTSLDFFSFSGGLNAQLDIIDQENRKIRDDRRYKYVLGSFAEHVVKRSIGKARSSLSHVFKFGNKGGRKTRKNKKRGKHRKRTRKNI